MNRKELMTEHMIFCGTARSLMERKNNDYAGGQEARPFANFERAEQLGICTTAQAILVRMTDKMSRLVTAVSGTKLRVSDESLEDTCLDMLNYTILLHAWCKQDREELRKALARPEDDIKAACPQPVPYFPQQPCITRKLGAE